MKNNLFRGLILALVIAAILFVSLRNTRGQYFKLTGLIQGTSYHITYQSRNGENLQHEIDSLLADFDRSCSIYLPGSVISRINRNDPAAEADEILVEIFKKSAEISRKTGGAFDITVGPLVNAWGFGYTSASDIDSSLIDSLMQFVGMDKVRLSGSKIIKADPGVMLDVNAIAQGYSVDVVARYLDKKKIRNYMVEIGGEVSTKGRNDKGNIWRIGLDRPLEGNVTPGTDLQAILQLKRKSLATSGNYRKFYEKDGVKYAHTIDPKTGYPVISNLLSATVIAGDCMTADACATACMVMGLERSIEFLNRNKSLDAYLIYNDEKGRYKVYSSEGFSRYLLQEL